MGTTKHSAGHIIKQTNDIYLDTYQCYEDDDRYQISWTKKLRKAKTFKTVEKAQKAINIIRTRFTVGSRLYVKELTLSLQDDTESSPNLDIKPDSYKLPSNFKPGDTCNKGLVRIESYSPDTVHVRNTLTNQWLKYVNNHKCVFTDYLRDALSIDTDRRLQLKLVMQYLKDDNYIIQTDADTKDDKNKGLIIVKQDRHDIIRFLNYSNNYWVEDLDLDGKCTFTSNVSMALTTHKDKTIELDSIIQLLNKYYKIQSDIKDK
jgi:hypothetical protein